MATKNPFEFVQEVREEANKVTWPTRRETMITSMMVLALIVIASMFFFVVDFFLNKGVHWLLFSLPIGN
jgi:preprotein translocase subunit SecE